LAEITSTASGDYDAGATWVGGVAPTDTDSVVIDATHTVSLNGNRTNAGVTINANGVLQPTNDADTLTINGDLDIDGTLGKSTWTGNLTIGRDMVGSGTYLHGNQTVTFNGTTCVIRNDFTFYNLTSDAANLYLGSGVNTVVENTTTINISKKMCTAANTGNTTLTIGTISKSGTMINNGGFWGHTAGGSGIALIQAASSSYYANIEGAGVYYWDCGGSHGEVHWKWLNHKGTGADAKKTGGNGVTIVLDGDCRHDSSFTVNSGDTFDEQEFSFHCKDSFQVEPGAILKGNAVAHVLSGGALNYENMNVESDSTDILNLGRIINS